MTKQTNYGHDYRGNDSPNERGTLLVGHGVARWVGEDKRTLAVGGESLECVNGAVAEPAYHSSYASVRYDNPSGEGEYPWKASVYLYTATNLDTPADTFTGSHHSLGDALVWCANIIRGRKLAFSRIDVHAGGSY